MLVLWRYCFDRETGKMWKEIVAPKVLSEGMKL